LAAEKDTTVCADSLCIAAQAVNLRQSDIDDLVLTINFDQATFVEIPCYPPSCNHLSIRRRIRESQGTIAIAAWNLYRNPRRFVVITQDDYYAMMHEIEGGIDNDWLILDPDEYDEFCSLMPTDITNEWFPQSKAYVADQNG
jgi:hypothetical protein